MKRHVKLFENFVPLTRTPEKVWHLFIEHYEPLSLGVFDSEADAKAERQDYIREGLRKGGEPDELENLYFIQPIQLDDHDEVASAFKMMVDQLHFGGDPDLAKELIERFIALGADPKDMLLMEEWMDMDEIIKDLMEIFGGSDETILSIFQDRPDLLKKYGSNIIRRDMF